MKPAGAVTNTMDKDGLCSNTLVWWTICIVEKDVPWTQFYGFFCDIAVSFALNRFVQLGAPFAIILFYLHGLFYLQLKLY